MSARSSTSTSSAAAAAAGLAAGAVALLLALELLLRLLPVSTASLTGYHFDADVLTYPAHHRWRTSTGWDLRNVQALESNNAGFVAARDFVRDERAIGLIGDSYIEASMLDPADRPGAQLERAVGGRPVYALGSPGTALLDYAERMRLASTRWGVRDFVFFVERGDVEQVLCGSGNVHSVCLDPRTLARRSERQPPAGTAKRLLRHSALAQYLASQLKVDSRRLVATAFRREMPQSTQAQAANPGPSAEAERRAAALADAVADEFLRAIAPYRGGRMVMIFDNDRAALESGRMPHTPARDRFMTRMQEAGVQVVDMSERYRASFAATGRSTLVGPYDHHLNALGVHLLAGAAAAAIR